jgi:adenylylsulfate kinase
MEKMKEVNPSLIVWHGGQVCQAERQKLLGQQPVTVWLTGLSASGKSTLAFALERALVDQGRACYVLDGDNVRHGLNRDLGFSHEDRTENIRRIAEVARLMNDAGLIVITAFISPYCSDRSAAREVIGAMRFREVFVSTSLSVCESRDPKGLYSKARAGKVVEFTGVSSPYEVPDLPDLAIDTTQISVDDAVLQLVSLVARAQPVL